MQPILMACWLSSLKAENEAISNIQVSVRQFSHWDTFRVVFFWKLVDQILQLQDSLASSDLNVGYDSKPNEIDLNGLWPPSP